MEDDTAMVVKPLDGAQMKATSLDPGPPPPAGDPTHSPFARDCLAGLAASPKSLPCKWLYDDAGSRLFSRITTLDEYYPTRVEEALIGAAAPVIAALLETPTTLVELGSGASRKTRLLLDAAAAIASYVAIDISAEELARACRELASDFPDLEITPRCADFTIAADLGLSDLPGPTLLFFPGSTLGNMAPPQATGFLRSLRAFAGHDTRLLLGVDLLKDERILCAAYDDAAGVTAAFNLNLLARIASELGGTIDTDAFRHRAIWNAAESRIEMHLQATSRQEIKLLGRRFPLAAGETIHTENSYKLPVERWRSVFAAAGWRMAVEWQSPPPSFLLALLEPSDEGISQ